VAREWLYPGWQVGDKPSFTDPREPAPSPEEVGRGPLSDGKGRFLAVRRDVENSVTTLEMVIGGVEITLGLNARLDAETGERWVQSSIMVGPHKEPLAFMTGHTATGKAWQPLTPEMMGVRQADTVCLLAATEAAQVLVFALGTEGRKFQPREEKRRVNSWRESVTTQATLSTKPDAHVVDTIPLPVPNPWKRNVRLADLDFLDDQGNAAGVTFDGDVWLISGLKGDLENVTWKRFASGLHEPMSIDHANSNSECRIRNPHPQSAFRTLRLRPQRHLEAGGLRQRRGVRPL
jgi:hypothetical protein